MSKKQPPYKKLTDYDIARIVADAKFGLFKRAENQGEGKHNTDISVFDNYSPISQNFIVYSIPIVIELMAHEDPLPTSEMHDEVNRRFADHTNTNLDHLKAWDEFDFNQQQAIRMQFLLTYWLSQNREYVG